jgi:hypothetical protein
MDPEKRRHTWDLINKHKPGRTILFTTHFMEEADLLGDRIAIMTKGALSTVGSSLFLKNRFGVGYHVTLTKGKGFKEGQITKLIKGPIPAAQTLSNVGTEMTFLLPEAAAASFPSLFRQLETQKGSLGLVEFGCSSTTMEEVFLHVGELEEHKGKLLAKDSGGGGGGGGAGVAETGLDWEVDAPPALSSAAPPPPAYVKPPRFRGSHDSQSSVAAGGDGGGGDAEGGGHKAYVDTTPPPHERNTGVSLWLQRTKALFVKKKLHAQRHRATLLCQTVLPTLLVFSALATTHFQAAVDVKVVAPCRSLSPRGKTVYSGANTADYDEFSFMSDATAADFAAITAMDTTTMQTDLQAATVGFCADTGKTLKPPSTAGNSLTEAIQGDARDFLRTQFYQKNQVGSTFHQGSSYVTYSPSNGGECVLSGSPLFDNNASGHGATAPGRLQLMEGVWYAFKYGGGDYVHNVSVASANGNGGGEGLDFLRVEGLSTYCCTNEWCNPAVRDGCAFYEDYSGGVLFKATSGVNDANLQLRCHDPTNETKSATVDFNVTTDRAAAFAPLGTTAFAWYSPKLLHSPAEAVNLVGNTIGRAHTGNAQLRIRTNNCPLRKTTEEQANDKAQEAAQDGVSIMLFLSCAVAAMAASYITFVVEERALHAKHIQFVSGATEYMYWAGTWGWDVINLQLPLVLIFVVYAAFTLKDDAYRGDNMGYLFLVMFVGFPALLPMQYCLSWLFANRTSAFAVSFIGFGLLTFAQLLTSTIMRVPALNALNTQKTLHTVFLLFPTYAVVDGMIQISANHGYLEFCGTSGPASLFQADDDGDDDGDDDDGVDPCKDIRCVCPSRRHAVPRRVCPER